MRKIGEDEKMVYNSMFEDFDPIYEFEPPQSSSIYHQGPSPRGDHVSNLEKHNKILKRAKESIRKKSVMSKVKFEKNIETLTLENDRMAQELKEKDKELKL